MVDRDCRITRPALLCWPTPRVVVMASIRWLGHMPGSLRRPGLSCWNFARGPAVYSAPCSIWPRFHKLPIQIPAGGFLRGFAAPLVMPGRRFSRPDIITNNIMRADSAKEVLQVISNEIANPDLDLTAVSAAIVRIAHLQDTLTADVRADPQFSVVFALGGSMLRSVAKRGKTSDQRQCSNILWAVAKLDQRMSTQLSSLRASSLAAVKATASHMDAQGAANIVWAAARLQLSQAEREEVLAAVAGRLGDVVDKLKPQDVVNILRGAADLRSRSAKLFPSLPLLRNAAERVLPDFNEQHIADVIWSCAKLKDVPELPKLVPIFVPRVKEHLSSRSLPCVAMVIWSLAELHQQCPVSVQLLPSLLDAFMKADSAKLNPMEISEVLRAVAMLQQLPEVVATSERLCKKACKLDRPFATQGVATILWSAGILRLEGATSAPLLQRMCKEARSTLSSFSPPQISNSCLGLALSGWKDAALMDAFADAMVKKVRDADAAVVTTCLPPMMYSLAKLQMPGHEPLLNACVGKFDTVLPTISDLALGDLAWSYEKLDSENRYAAFRSALQDEITKRSVSLEQVECREVGPESWLHGDEDFPHPSSRRRFGDDDVPILDEM
ncbi:unnamed protein product [Symbiodinium sp. CCMP2592]|nr:unnamed protein product [Symbiodinium sp. CCMP2592]